MFRIIRENIYHALEFAKKCIVHADKEIHFRRIKQITFEANNRDKITYSAVETRMNYGRLEPSTKFLFVLARSISAFNENLAYYVVPAA